MKLINWFYKHNSKKYLLYFGVIALIGISLIYSRYFGIVTISNDKVLDMFLIYDRSFFYEVLHSLSDSEILAYKLIHLADYVFAIGFYPTLSLIITKIVDKTSKFRFLVLLPMFSGLFDILENLSMDIHLYSYPTEYLFIGGASSIFTFVKFSLLLITIVFIIVLLISKRRK